MTQTLSNVINGKNEYRFAVISTDLSDSHYGMIDTSTSTNLNKDLEGLIISVGGYGSVDEEHFFVVSKYITPLFLIISNVKVFH